VIRKQFDRLTKAALRFGEPEAFRDEVRAWRSIGPTLQPCYAADMSGAEFQPTVAGPQPAESQSRFVAPARRLQRGDSVRGRLPHIEAAPGMMEISSKEGE